MDIRRWAVVAATATAIVSLGGTGMAQDREGGFYASMTGLLSMPRDTQRKETADGHFVTTDYSMKNGMAFVVAGGYILPSGLRTELELGFRRTEFDKVRKTEVRGPDPDRNAAAHRALPIDGRFTTFSVMANATYGTELGRFRPYVGGGVGLARHQAKIDSIAYAARSKLPAASIGFSENSTVFAFQLMAGIGYPLSEQAEMWLGYRYFETADADFRVTEMTFSTHNFELGLLYKF